jgi:hypothetical protein
VNLLYYLVNLLFPFVFSLPHIDLTGLFTRLGSTGHRDITELQKYIEDCTVAKLSCLYVASNHIVPSHCYTIVR